MLSLSIFRFAFLEIRVTKVPCVISSRILDYSLLYFQKVVAVLNIQLTEWLFFANDRFLKWIIRGARIDVLAKARFCFVQYSKWKVEPVEFLMWVVLKK